MPTNAKNMSMFNGRPMNSKDIQLGNPQGIASVYANEFGLILTLTDVRLIFAEVGIDAEKNAPSKVLKANVVIPLQGAEALARHMLSSIDQHKKHLKAVQDAEQATKS